MIKGLPIKKFIRPFIGVEGRCPFCKIELEQAKWRIGVDPLPKLICPQLGHCPYFFEIFSFANQEKKYNVIELTNWEQFGCRVWIGDWAKRHQLSIIKIGEHQHIPCVLLPYKKADFSDMERFAHRIRTIVTFN